MAVKPKLSMYWASSCGGCEIALVNIDEKILDVAANFDFFFCPCLLDTKKADVETLDDGEIAVTFFNGAIRTLENEEMAHLMRRKSKVLIAFGSCACEGCIPGLSNLHTRAAHFKSIYLSNPTIDNPLGIVPKPETEVPEGTLTLPEFYERVKTLSQVVDVDYFIPGCPPEPTQVWTVIDTLIQTKTLPPRGGIIGAGNSTVCRECDRKKEDKRISRLYRTYEIIPDTEACLLDQGLICMGLATADGCGSLCPKVNMPCTGCYGPPAGVLDQGAKMTAALGSIIDIGETKGLSEDELTRRVDLIIDSIPDYSGTFYKYSLAGSILGGRRT
jgi:F420-non-reducing hydrogenase small subunit